MDSPGKTALHLACNALWLATLSLMTTFMQTSAPAHRYLLARRIATNFGTLSAESCFSTSSRASFSRLERRWSSKADLLAPPMGYADPGFGLPAPY